MVEVKEVGSEPAPSLDLSSSAEGKSSALEVVIQSPMLTLRALPNANRSIERIMGISPTCIFESASARSKMSTVWNSEHISRAQVKVCIFACRPGLDNG